MGGLGGGGYGRVGVFHWALKQISFKWHDTPVAALHHQRALKPLWMKMTKSPFWEKSAECNPYRLGGLFAEELRHGSIFMLIKHWPV